VYESIYKPYITIQADVLDNVPGGLIKSLDLKPGDPIEFSFDSVENQPYDGKVYLSGIDKDKKKNNLRSTSYVIDGIGPAWFRDQQSIVKQSYQFIPATQVMASIHNNYVGGDAPLRILDQSIGPVDQEAYRVFGIKPFKAIENLMARATYGSVKTGTTMYYRDQNSYVLSPLETLFKQLQAQETFFQDNTLGRYITDFDKAKITITQIAAHVDQTNPGRQGANKVAAASSQGVGHFNLRSSKNTILQAKKMITSQLGQAIRGGTPHGGRANYFMFDPSKLSKEQQEFQKVRDENAYKAQFINGTNFTVMVPINNGTKLTVGKGVGLKLLAPQGDLSTYAGSDQSGVYMVTTLVHALTFGDTLTNGFTCFECSDDGNQNG
jgi:prepilin-type processing-associated H-X9-DG protein